MSQVQQFLQFSPETLNVEVDDRGVATLTMMRSEKHNALNALMIREMRTAVQLLSADNTVRVVILAAAGKSFCAGGDLGWMQEQAAKDRAGKIQESSQLAYMLRELDTLPKPLIGRVQGAAYGGGVGMLSVCDTVVAADTCKFALTETKLGLIPATIGPYVVRRMGEGNARRVFMSGKVFGATQAQALGLVTEVATADELDDKVEAEVKPYLSCAPGAVADAKALCLHLARESGESDGMLDYTAGKLADRWESDEARHGIACFFAKKKADWVE